jgi:D-threo-aldose 1-dehydrogenase
MDPFLRRRIGNTAFAVTQLGMGGASLGDARESIPETQAEATLECGHAGGIGYFDTSPWYGNTKSELRFGRVLRTKPRDSFVLSTKVGRIHVRPANPDTYTHPRWAGGLPFEPRFDYTHDAVLKSYEHSLARLGLNRVDALLIHDLDQRFHLSQEGVTHGLDQLDTGGGYRALADLKARGEIKAIGAGVNLIGMIPQFLERFAIDFFLIAMPYTLLEQEALDGELQLCGEHGVSVVIGAPFASGILARGPQPGALYGYRRAEPEILEKAQKIAAVCARHGVPLAAAALQFPLGHPSVVSVIPGPVTPEEVRLNFASMRVTIPDALWAELKAERLIRADAPTPSLTRPAQPSL